MTFISTLSIRSAIPARVLRLHCPLSITTTADVTAGLMRHCKAPTLVMAAEKDCLFPGPGVIERAKQIIPDCETYLLEGRGHMNFLSDEEKKMIVDFLKD